MVKLRRLLACLVMLAIPLQGFAAATMLFCGMAADHLAVESMAGAQPVITHLAEGGGQVHGSGYGAAPHRDDAQHAMTVDSGEHVPPTDSATPVHSCTLCASCCHSVAISETVPFAPTAPPPPASFEDLLVLVQSQPAVVPDKPPRA